MTALPRMQSRSVGAQDGRRAPTATVPATEREAGATRDRARQALPVIDPSKEFGCVDWYLYPDEATPEARLERARA